MPAPLRKYLTGHHVETAYERGWATMENGNLLAATQTAFDLFLTTDKNLRYQQNLAGRTIAIAILPTTQWPILETQVESLAAQIGAIKPGRFVDITIS